MQRYLVLNGPNLNLLGTRDPAIYGFETLDDVEDACRRWGAELGVEIDAVQTNHEGVLIDTLHEARHTHQGVIFNPGAYTHTSYALADAVTAIGVPTVEVHISNVEEREPWRRTSLIRPACVATVYGRGIDGYRWAMRHLFHRHEWPFETVRYADHEDGVMDLRRPKGDGRRVGVVLVHGGFWRHMWTRDTMEGIAIDLARRGYLVANVEYRRVGTGGGWPDSVEDVAAAVEHLMGIEPMARLAVVGHSAGGHLAVMAGTRTSVTFLPVALAGVLDIEQAVAEDVGAGAVGAFLDDADPSDASPVRVAARVETVVVHGTDDDRVPISQSRAYAAANPRCELVELPAVGHFEFLERSDAAWMRVATLLSERLRL